MVKLIEADTQLDAWVKAVRLLLDADTRRTLNVVLAIGQPQYRGMSPSTVGVIDEFFVSEGQLPIHTVAETIFPGFEYRSHGLRGVLEIYPDEVYPNIKKTP